MPAFALDRASSRPIVAVTGFAATVATWRGLALWSGTALLLFTSPALPADSADAGLRSINFFNGLATHHPWAVGDGPLAFLRAPAFGQGHALAHIICELAAAVTLALAGIVGLAQRNLLLQAVAALALVVISAVSREAAWWLASAFLVAGLWEEKAPARALLAGVGVGLAGLLSSPLTWFGLIAMMGTARRGGSLRLTGTALLGWLLATGAGWATARPAHVGHFLVEGFTPALGLLLVAVCAALAIARFFSAGAHWMLLATAILSTIGATLNARWSWSGVTLAHWQRAWSVIAHPERFERRVLAPYWRNLAASHPLPGITEELGAQTLAGAPGAEAVAIANALPVRSVFRTGGTGPMLVSAEKPTDTPGHVPLFTESGQELRLVKREVPPSFSPWTWIERRAHQPLPMRIEAGGRPTWSEEKGAMVAVLPTPARVTVGPAGRHNPAMRGSFEWRGAGGILRAYQLRADGTTTLETERGLNPEENPADAGLQGLSYPLEGSGIDALLLAADSHGRPAEFRLQPFTLEREFTRIFPWSLGPRVLLGEAGFNSIPLAIFAATEAMTGRGETGDLRLLLHVPANLKFAKPAAARRVRANFGFVTNAYADPAAGTNGAVFSVVLHSGSGYSRELYSRALRPRTVEADRGVQSMDLDLADLPDGILDFTIGPIHPGETAFGWTFWGEVQLDLPDLTTDAEAWRTAMDHAHNTGIRPIPASISRSDQAVTIFRSGSADLFGVHAPTDILIGAQAGVSRIEGKFGMWDDTWRQPQRTDGAEFIVLWRDHTGETVLFRRVLDPVQVPADRGPQSFQVSVEGRGSGIVVLRTTQGPGGQRSWDWTGWSEVRVW